ncbi:unnamed protein product [Ophioblennius macclurei]
MKEPRNYRSLTQNAICNLNITLPSHCKTSRIMEKLDPQDEAERKEQWLAIIADHLGFSWTELAQELDFSEENVNLIRIENPNSLQDQSHALLKLWAEKEGMHATEAGLIKTLTKINRMDIVHLIETKITKSTLDETSSHTYAEIEQTIALDHSEGFSALHEDIDSPRPGRRTEAARQSPGSGREVSIVSAEDLSSSLSSLHETAGREMDSAATSLLRNARKEKLQKEMGTTYSSQTIYEEVKDSGHTGSYKQVSPFFSVYRTSPYNLCSHAMDPKGDLKSCVQVAPPPYPTFEASDDEGAAEGEGAEGGEDWSLECLQTSQSGLTSGLLSPLPWRETSNSSRTGVCESRPLSMTDFGDSLFEGEHAEQDFRKLSMELTGADYISEKMRFTPTREQSQQPTQRVLVDRTMKEYMHTEETATSHMDEVSRRLYKVLYGYEANPSDSNVEYVFASHNDANQTVMKDDVQGAVTCTLPDSEFSVSTMVEIGTCQDLVSGDRDVRSSRGMNQTPNANKTFASLFDVSSQIPGVMPQHPEIMTCSAFIQASHESHLLENTPNNEILASVELTTDSDTPHDVFPSTASMSEIGDALSSSDLGDTSVLLSESRSSTPNSVRSMKERHTLAPDSPVPQIRPLSPLPPPVFPWTSDIVGASNPTQPFHNLPSLPLLLTEERPLTPMVSNRRPFGRPVSPGSDYSGERSISPKSLIFDIEDRTSSPESVTLETVYGLFSPSERGTPDLHETRLPSPDSTGSVSAGFPPDSPVPPTCDLIVIGECRSPSAGSESTYSETDMAFLSMHCEDRPLSPQSLTSVDEYKVLSPDSPLPEFSRIWSDSSKTVSVKTTSPGSVYSHSEYGSKSLAWLYREDRALSPASLTLGDEYDSALPLTTTEPAPMVSYSISDDLRPKSPTIAMDLTSVHDDDWITIFPSDVEKRPLSPDSVEKHCVEKFKTETGVIFNKSKEILSSMESKFQVEKDVTESVKPDISHIPISLEGTVLSDDKIFEEVSPELLNVKVTMKENFEAKQNIMEYHKESSGFTPKLYDEPQSSDQAVAHSLLLETTSEPAYSLSVMTEESSALQPQHNIKLSFSEHCTSVYSLTYDTDLRKLISQIYDPQYAGETFMSKTGMFQLTGTTTDYSENSEKTVEDKVADSPSELHQRSLSLTFEPEYQPLSPESLMLQGTDSQHPFTPPPSPDSDDKNRPLSPISPIPEYSQISPECPLFDAFHRSLSPVSAWSDLEYGTSSPSESFEVRPSSPDSVCSGNGYRGDSPIPQFKTGLFESLSISTHRASSPESVFSDVEEAQSSAEFNISDTRPDSPESQISDCAERLSGATGQALKAVWVPVYRLVYDAELWKLISQIQDPQYVGETFVSKTGVFEYVGTRLEYVVKDSDASTREPKDRVKSDTGEVLKRAESPDSESEYAFSVHKGDSPTSLKDSCPDCLVPQFVSDKNESRTYSPQSDWSDEQLDFCMVITSDDNRPLSPHSVISLDENCTLSPDSPLPDFTPVVPESFQGAFKSRSSSPESVLSDIEDGFSSLVTDMGQRPDSPDSIGSSSDHKQSDAYAICRAHQLICQLYDPHYMVEIISNSAIKDVCDSAISTDSLLDEAEYRRLSSETLSVLRSYSRDSKDSDNDSKLLSQDSPNSQFSASVFQYPAVEIPISAESVSDTELKLSEIDIFSTTLRSSSEYSLSEQNIPFPDSPLPGIGSELHASSSVTGTCRYFSYDSDHSEVENLSGTNIRCLSSESAGIRPVSPDSTTSINESRPLSPDSPLPQFLQNIDLPQFISGSRSSSPCAMSNTDSNVDEDLSNIDLMERFFTPDSEIDFRILSPDSPIPEFKPFVLEPPIILSAKCRSTSPESLYYSDIDYQNDLFASVSDEQRPQSPDSEASGDKSDSPVPQFTGKVVERFPSFVGFRSTLPKVTAADTEHLPLIVSPCHIEDKSDTSKPSKTKDRVLSTNTDTVFQSPGSFISESSQTVHKSTCLAFRSSSPESVASDSEIEIENLMPLFDDQPSSLDSLGSQSKNKRLSPESPIPEFRLSSPVSFVDFSRYRLSFPGSIFSDNEFASSVSGLFQEEERPDSPQSFFSTNEYQDLSESPIPHYTHFELYSQTVMCRSTSPLSVFSDEDLETDLCMHWLFQDRAESPNSAACEDESALLPPDSPIPEFTRTPHESMVSSVVSRSPSPESVLSDLEMELSSLLFFEDRPSSPESLHFCNYSRVSPDSPVPDFRQAWIETNSQVCIYRSSPESEFSELEQAPLISEIVDFEDRAASCQSWESDCDLRCLSPDSPLPQYALHIPSILGIRYRSVSPESVYSENDLETDLCISLLFEDRADSPASAASENECRPLSPDSPIPQFIGALSDPFTSHMVSRSSSLESVLSDLEMGLSSVLFLDDLPSSPEPLQLLSHYGRLSPDSPVQDFRQPLIEAYPHTFDYRSSSPQSEFSEVEYAPLISQMCDFDDTSYSLKSWVSEWDLRSLSPDSPLLQYTSDVNCSIRMTHRSVSPESFYSDDDLETDLCFPWHFDDRVESPDSSACEDTKLRPLTPDSPIPHFTLHECTSAHMNLKSASPESLLSDWEVDSPFQTSSESRPSSPESLSLLRLSPDSPLPDFAQAVLELHESVFRSTSASPESTCSDDEYFILCLGSLVFDKRASSPGSGASGDEYQALSAESPILEYQPAVHERVIVNIGYQSPSPEPIESDVEEALSELLISMNFDVGDRPDSLKSAESDIEDRPLSVESLPEYKPMSPEALSILEHIHSVSPDSTQSLDEYKRLSPDSPLPWFQQTALESVTADRHYWSSSPESSFSDVECHLAYPPSCERTLSSQSQSSDDNFRPMSPESPIPDFTKTCAENALSVGTISPTELCDLGDLLPSPIPYFTEERPTSLEATDSDWNEIQTLKSLVHELEAPLDCTSIDKVEPLLSEQSALATPEFNLVYDAELWKLISQIHDPQYAGETFSSKTGFMQPIGNSKECERSVQPHHEQDKTVKGSPEEDVSEFPTTNQTLYDHVCTSMTGVVSVSESPLPVIELAVSSEAAPYRQKEYKFETADSDDDDWVIISDVEDDSLCCSPESLMDFMPMPTISDLVETRASSPESIGSVSEVRPLSPDSPLPEFTVAQSQCVQGLRSASCSPETLATSLEFMPLYWESYFVDGRPSSPESVHMTDRRVSSPESMPEFSENRSLSPDSPIPQFVVSLEEYPVTYWTSSPESFSSDSECELMVTSWRAADTDRPSSPESISSVSEFSRLLPDSPVPEFMRILSSYFMDATVLDRSSSPMSLTSDSEFEALPIDCWIDDSPRPPSPDSFESGDESGFGSASACRFISNTEPLMHLTSPYVADQSTSLPDKRRAAVSQSPLEAGEKKSGHEQFSLQQQQLKISKVLSDEDWTMNAHEGDITEDLSVYVGGTEEKILKSYKKNKTTSERPHPETPQSQADDETCSQLLLATAATQDTSKTDVLVIEDKTKSTVPLQLPQQSSYKTHRSVTPVLPPCERAACSEWEPPPDSVHSTELFSPVSAEFLMPPNYEAVFAGHQNLGVSERSQTSRNEFSPVSPVFRDSHSDQVATERKSESSEEFEFCPNVERVLLDFEMTASELGSRELKVMSRKSSKGSESPHLSDSDVEFFDCRQAFSDVSEPEDVNLDRQLTPYCVSEPCTPIPVISFLKDSSQYSTQPFLHQDYKHFSSGSQSLGVFAYDSEGSRECPVEGVPPVELPSRDQAAYFDDDDFLGREIAEELGVLSSDSSEEEVLTTRVVRRRVIIQADTLPDIPAQSVTEEKYTDEHGNMVVKKITRKVIRKYVSPDGMESQEVTIEGSHQETVQIEESDNVSRVVKRTVLRSGGDQKELTFSEPPVLSGATASKFEMEPVQGRKVSKVVKTTVVRGERMEKQTGDPSLTADLPSAREDFEKALSYAGGFGKVLLPDVAEKEVVQDDGSVVKRSQMRKSRIQKRIVVRDTQGKHVHLERLDDTEDALQPDALQQHLHLLLQRYCEEEEEQEEEEEEEEEEQEQNLD